MIPLLYFADKNQAIYQLIPSLEDIAAIQLAVILWNRNDVRNSLNEMRLKKIRKNYSVENNIIKMETIQHKVRCYTEQLWLTNSLMKKVQNFIKPIGNELLNWKEYHEFCMCEPHTSDMQLLDQFCWTVFGTINKKMTAQMLVRNQNLCIGLRYELACSYCFEADIMSLWNQQPCYCEKSINSEINTAANYSLVNLWNRVMEGEGTPEVLLGMIIEHDVPFEFKNYINQAAIEYFLTKVSPEVRRKLMDSLYGLYDKFFVSRDYQSEFFFYLLSQMSDEERMNHITKNPLKVLSCFLTWPYQSLFMQAACHMQYTDGINYALCRICDKISSKYEDSNYEELFWEIWHLVSETGKRRFINECVNLCRIFFHLFKVESKEIIQIIWKETTTEERETIIFYYEKEGTKYITDEVNMKYPFSYYLDLDRKDIWQKLFPFLINISRKERKK